MNSKIFFTCLIACLIVTSCNQGPKVISSPLESAEPNTSESTGIFSDKKSSSSTAPLRVPSATDLHTVTVLEVLPTSKYIYLRVNEDDKEFWIATGKKDVKVGEMYFYKNGILKTNFESKEHNRIFEQVYLVSNIVSANHGSESETSSSKIQTEKTPKDMPKIIAKAGSIKISDIVSNPEKYADQTVQLSGQCVKVNPNIMGRNWIHLKDGSQDDFDMVITSDMVVPEGHVVTMTGTVTLQKDFGAGYKYDIIIENGQVVK